MTFDEEDRVLRTVVDLVSKRATRNDNETAVEAVIRITGISGDDVRAILSKLRPHGVQLLHGDGIGVDEKALERFQKTFGITS